MNFLYDDIHALPGSLDPDFNLICSIPYPRLLSSTPKPSLPFMLALSPHGYSFHEYAVLNSFFSLSPHPLYGCRFFFSPGGGGGGGVDISSIHHLPNPLFLLLLLCLPIFFMNMQFLINSCPSTPPPYLYGCRYCGGGGGVDISSIHYLPNPLFLLLLLCLPIFFMNM